jgi:hypothetical protein
MGLSRWTRPPVLRWLREDDRPLDNGLRELRTGNEERNAAARAVNANFPYMPLPDGLLYRGPLAEA